MAIIGFTGLCLFVPHQNQRVVSVLLPDARTHKQSKDNKYNMPPHEPRIVHVLGGRKEFFRLPTKLRLPPDGPADADTDIACEHLINISELTSCKVDRAAARISRILLRSGHILCEPGVFEWEIVPSGQRGNYSSIVRWDLETKLPHIRLNGIDTADRFLDELEGSITIWHVPPHHYGHKPDPVEDGADDDFRWFYELFRHCPPDDGQQGHPVPVLRKIPQDWIGPLAATPETHTCLPAGGECEGDECDQDD